MTIPAGERRIVSVLVADVVGSTEIGEKLGPERSKFLFDDIVHLMREEVERFGGTVAQLTGDGVLAVFGAPVAHEDDSERAVRAALATNDAVRRYGAELGSAYGIELASRVAVNTGPVVIPALDATPDRLYNALGDTVNVAARLQALGDLVVGPETAHQVEDAFELEPLGEVTLKGKAEPVEAFRVVGMAAERRVRLTRFVGRDDELAALDEALADALDGRGSVVAITGEAGIGKSRLKSEVRERYDGQIRFLEGHAVSYAGDVPYWPIAELLRDWLGLGVSEAEARIRLELKAGLGRDLGDAAEDVYPFLATLLGVSLEREPAERLRDLSRDSVQQQTFDGVYRLASALARERPLCLVLEDLHWADEATLALLDALLPLTQEGPVVLLLSYRSGDEHAALDLADRARRRYRRRFHELELEALPHETAALLAAEVAAAELPAQVSELLTERSGGNPFFLEEAVHDLVEGGVLVRRNGQLQPAAAGELPIPAAVQETLQARLDRLEPRTRDVINIAAVVGRSFGMPLLERLVPAEDLRPSLSELERLDLVVEERRRPAPEYRFRHGLVQEVAYGSLLAGRRRELHRAVGDALEQLQVEAPTEAYGLLARHFAEADDPERAVHYLLRAGDAALAVYADQEALELYDRALGFVERTGQTALARETALKVALTHYRAFDFEHASEAYARALSFPTPSPVLLEPTETLEVATTRVDAVTPGHSYTGFGWELTANLYRGLVTIGPDFEIVPDLTDQIEISGDGLTYIFRLREDALWSDGVPVSAGDFAETWRRMREDSVATAHLLEPIDSTRALDERTLEIRLEVPTNYFLYLLGQAPYFAWPTHLVTEQDPDWHEARPLVGNGPFVLTELDAERARLVANPLWRGGRGNVAEVLVSFPANQEDCLAAWKEGRYGALMRGMAAGGGFAEGACVQTRPGAETFALGFRCDRPPLDDPVFRRALAHAFDRDDVARRSNVIGDPAGTGGMTPPTIPGHSHRVAPAFDRDRARALLDEAGYPGGEGLRELVLAYFDEWPNDGHVIAEQLADVGVRTRLVGVRADEYERFVAGGDADVWIVGWNADFPDPEGAIGTIFETPYVHRDEDVLALLARARSAPDRDSRLALYREAERLWIGERAEVVPLVYQLRVLQTRPWLAGMWVNALASSTLAEAIVSR